MKPAKYTKFGKNMLGKDQVFSYTAYDKENDSTLLVRSFPSFNSDLPGEISVTTNTLFDSKDPANHVTITEEEFWIAYKAVSVSLFRYLQDKTILKKSETTE